MDYYWTTIDGEYKSGTYEYLVDLINKSPYIHLHRIHKWKCTSHQ